MFSEEEYLTDVSRSSIELWTKLREHEQTLLKDKQNFVNLVNIIENVQRGWRNAANENKRLRELNERLKRQNENYEVALNEVTDENRALQADKAADQELIGALRKELDQYKGRFSEARAQIQNATIVAALPPLVCPREERAALHNTVGYGEQGRQNNETFTKTTTARTTTAATSNSTISSSSSDEHNRRLFGTSTESDGAGGRTNYDILPPLTPRFGRTYIVPKTPGSLLGPIIDTITPMVITNGIGQNAPPTEHERHQQQQQTPRTTRLPRRIPMRNSNSRPLPSASRKRRSVSEPRGKKFKYFGPHQPAALPPLTPSSNSIRIIQAAGWSTKGRVGKLLKRTFFSPRSSPTSANRQPVPLLKFTSPMAAQRQTTLLTNTTTTATSSAGPPIGLDDTAVNQSILGPLGGGQLIQRLGIRPTLGRLY